MASEDSTLNHRQCVLALRVAFPADCLAHPKDCRCPASRTLILDEGRAPEDTFQMSQHLARFGNGHGKGGSNALAVHRYSYGRH